MASMFFCIVAFGFILPAMGHRQNINARNTLPITSNDLDSDANLFNNLDKDGNGMLSFEEFRSQSTDNGGSLESISDSKAADLSEHVNMVKDKQRSQKLEEAMEE